MGDLLAALLVLVALMGVFFLLLGGMRRNGYAAKTLRGVGSYGMPEDGSRLAACILASAAASGALGLAGAGISFSVITGALVGGTTAITPRSVLRPFLEFAGLAGSVGAIWAFATDATCTSLPFGTRLLVILTLGLSALLGSVFAVIRGGIRSVSLLAIFAVFELLQFIGMPFGVPMFIEHAALVPVFLAIAGLLGFLGALAPGIVIGLGAFGVTIATALVSAGYGTTCATSVEPALLFSIVACAVVYLVTRKLVGPRPRVSR